MGLFGRSKGKLEDIPDEQLTWNQRQSKKYNSPETFWCDSDYGYNEKHRDVICACLSQSLGCNNLDDLIQMRAPRFHHAYTTNSETLYDVAKYIYDNLPNNNQYQQLQGKYDELQQRCEKQDEIIEKLMTQNEKLQNQLIEKANSQSSTFSR